MPRSEKTTRNPSTTSHQANKTIDSIFVNIYNDLDDECHESDDTQTDLCYELTTNYVERDGNDLSFTDVDKPPIIPAIAIGFLPLVIKSSFGVNFLDSSSKVLIFSPLVALLIKISFDSILS